MRLHRFIGAFDLTQQELSVSDTETVHQISNVFRLGKGDRVMICDGKMKEAEAEILESAPASLRLKILNVTRNNGEPIVDVTLYCGMLKKENFEFVVQKAVETGARRIVPIFTARTVKLGLDIDRMRKISKEAAEQSGRCIIPEVSEGMAFEAALNEAAAKGKIVLYNVNAYEMRPETVPHVGLFIGPEGGWEDAEIELAQKNDALIVGLGSLVLRSETAVIIATYLAAHP